MYVCVCTCMRAYVHTYVRMYDSLLTKSVCSSTTRACMRVRVCVCVRVGMHIHIYNETK